MLNSRKRFLWPFKLPRGVALITRLTILSVITGYGQVLADENTTEQKALKTPISTTTSQVQQALEGEASFEQYWFAKISERARAMAQQGYEQTEKPLPKVLSDLNYSEYRAIRYNPEKSIWRGEGNFELQLFHPGYLFKQPISINLVDDHQIGHALKFDPKNFIYEREAQEIADLPAFDTGHSGFRLHFPVNRSEYKDELIAFQGASYFRLVGPGQVYGLSARGIAIDTGEPSGEEFPTFTDYWLKKPLASDDQIELIALLNSPSLTAAYLFKLQVGTSAEMTVKAKIFLRDSVKKLGIAPLTSMFTFGENKTRFYDDFRPEVHDSDGLQILTSQGEWIWRPVTNPQQLRITASMINNLGGFGLFQRDRNFDNYLDTEAHYHQRPSYWVQPVGQWPSGRVELVEIPTADETNDNIVAYWVPDQVPGAGGTIELSYKITSTNKLPINHHYAYVDATRIGSASNPGSAEEVPDSHRLFVVDFAGKDLQALDASQPVTVNFEAHGGTAKKVQIAKLPGSGKWRVRFVLVPDGKRPVDMRLDLSLRDQKISEVWNYVWSGDAID